MSSFYWWLEPKTPNMFEAKLCPNFIKTMRSDTERRSRGLFHPDKQIITFLSCSSKACMSFALYMIQTWVVKPCTGTWVSLMMMSPYRVEHGDSFLNFLTFNVWIAFKLHGINTNLHSKNNRLFGRITPLVNKVLIAILVPTSSYLIKFLSQTKMAWTAKNNNNNNNNNKLYALLFSHFSYHSRLNKAKLQCCNAVA